MPPIPCSHCGNNFMMPTNNLEAPKLCNNCIIREDRRTNKGEKKMDIVSILIECPREIQVEIEEICINQGVNFTQYFLGLHDCTTRELHETEVLFDARNLKEKNEESEIKEKKSLENEKNIKNKAKK